MLKANKIEHRSKLVSVAAVACVSLLLVTTASAQKINLDQNWNFFADTSGSAAISSLPAAQSWRPVRVGLSWNAQFADLRDYMGAAWYRSTFPAVDLSGGHHALLTFGAVDYYSEVFVNGKRVGTHEGGYTPFTFDITDALHQGVNDLAVRVVDPPMDEKDNRARFPKMLYNEIPHGKQNWYVQTGGIWQPVWIEIKPKDYITSVKVSAKVDGSVNVLVFSNAHLGPPPPMPAPGTSGREVPRQTILDVIHVRVIDPAGNGFDLKLKGGGGAAVNDYVYFEGRVPSPKLWSPGQSTLYTVVATLGDDRVTDRFGFRSFEARDGKFYLNGEPFYMIAALDQDFYPETIYTPPSEEYLRDEMLKGKRLGLNLLRCHIKVCDPTYLKVADEVGMLVWYEIPSWNDFNHFAPKAAERGERIFREMVERDWNHPSIVIQSIINEGWGVDLAHQSESRRWLRAAFDRAKTLTAPLGRLIVDNSACCDNFHLKTDIEDNHRYNSIPDDYRPFDQWIADFAARPKWNFSPHGDAEPTGREPLVLSEFGNWGLPKLPKDLPWWFGRGFGDRPVTKPAGLFERFKEFRFRTLFRDYDELAVATQWHQYVSLKHEIEEIRRHASIQGYVITEFTDINWEANGLLSMWREPKAYAAQLGKIQQPDLVIVRTDKKNYTSGQSMQIEGLLSHYGTSDLKAAKLVWRNEVGKKLATQELAKEIAPASVTPIARRAMPAPEVTRPQRQIIRLEVHDKADRIIAGNEAEVFIYPKAKPATHTAVSVSNLKQSSGLKPERLAAAGYTVLDPKVELAALNRPTLMIGSALDDEVERHLRKGGRALILANAKEALPSSGPLKITPRAGSDLDGNWVTNFNWVRFGSLSPFSAVAFTKILGFESERVVPRFVIQGIDGANYDDVLSGVFYGWLNNNAALAVQMRVGRGQLLLTTFRFEEYGADPYATDLLDSLIRYASGSTIQPRFVYEGSGTAYVR